MLVMKFGGTSVGSAERILGAAKIVQNRLEDRPVVVVSAVAGVTNELIEIAKEKSSAARIDRAKSLCDKHDGILKELELDPSLLEDERRLFIELVSAGAAETKPELDAYVSFGERFCAPLMAGALGKIGVAAKSYPAWEIGMITDGNFGSAEPLESSFADIAEKIKALKEVPVVTGYIGKTKKGEITTLGRGGSDYTAAILGAALKASAIQIWKEVDGILTTDPRLVPEARVVPELAFEEAAELAYFGAKVLHPKTILPAMQAGVPVQVLNTFNPAGKGTTIVSSFADRKEKSRSVEALSFKKGVIAVHIYSPEFFDGSGLMARIFGILEKHQTSVDVVSTSVASVSITVDKEEHLEKIVEELKELGEVAVERGKSMVCAVGGSVNAAGVAGKMFSALGESGIAVEMISQAAGGISITFVLDESKAEEALKLLHREHIENVK